MDSLITFDEAAEFLKNPPSLSPRPDFSKHRALRKNMVKALKQLMCPQSAIHGWSGMVLSPMVYALLKPNPFCHSRKSWPSGSVHTICHSCNDQEKQRSVLMPKKRSPILRKHPTCMLPHARCKRSRPIQGFQHPIPHWMECKHVNHRHPQPTTGLNLRQTGHNDSPPKQHTL